MLPAKLVRFTSVLLAAAFVAFSAPTARAATNPLLSAVQSNLHGQSIDSASEASLIKALSATIATQKGNAPAIIAAVLGARSDRDAIAAALVRAAIIASGAAGNDVLIGQIIGRALAKTNYEVTMSGVLQVGFSFEPSGTGRATILQAVATNQSNAFLLVLAKAAVKKANSNSQAASIYVLAILNGGGTRIVNKIAFAAAAISGAPHSTSVVKAVVSAVAQSLSSANSRAILARALVRIVGFDSPKLVSAIAVGVAHQDPANYIQILKAAVLADPSRAAEIASALAQSMSLQFANSIAATVGSALKNNSAYPELAPKIASKIALAINGKMDAPLLRAQETAQVAFNLISFLNPSSSANQGAIFDLIGALASAVKTTPYFDTVIGTLYKALAAVNPNTTFLNGVQNAFLAQLPSSLKPAALAAIASVKGKTDGFVTGPVPITESAAVKL